MTTHFVLHQIAPEAAVLALMLMALAREIRRERRSRARTNQYRSRLVYRDARTSQDRAWRDELNRAHRLDEASGLAENELADILGISNSVDRNALARAAQLTADEVERGNAYLVAQLGLPVAKAVSR